MGHAEGLLLFSNHPGSDLDPSACVHFLARCAVHLIVSLYRSGDFQIDKVGDKVANVWSWDRFYAAASWWTQWKAC